MRKSLIKSSDDSPVKGFDRYAKGSTVLCQSCAKPIYTLDAGIALGDKAGRMAERFRPISLADLDTLASRRDIDAGVRAMVGGWDLDARKAHCAQIHDLKSGDAMICPICHDVFVQVLAVEKNEVLDKAYTIELMTLPPQGSKPVAVRGKRISATGEWVH